MFNFIKEGPLKKNQLPQSYWFSEGVYSIYCRRTHIVFKGVRYSAFVIANIECPREHRGKKHFKDLLPRIESEVQQCGYSCLVFESVLNLRFERFLIKNNYAVDKESILENAVKVFTIESSCIDFANVI